MICVSYSDDQVQQSQRNESAFFLPVRSPLGCSRSFRRCSVLPRPPAGMVLSVSQWSGWFRDVLVPQGWFGVSMMCVLQTKFATTVWYSTDAHALLCTIRTTSAFSGIVGQLARLQALEGLRLQMRFHAEAHEVSCCILEFHVQNNRRGMADNARSCFLSLCSKRLVYSSSPR